MTTADIVITDASWLVGQEEHHRKKALDVMVTGRRSIDRVTNRQKGKLYIDRETEDHVYSREITSIRHGTAHDMKTRAVVPNGKSTMAMQTRVENQPKKAKTVRAKHAALTIETCDARA
ncbi:hypothetical protein DD238_008570 [Peronospora effusa]|uniref:Uncharacterized protein n=1 Tax=Peronospora effusa TaxID=542832 RepID=A0A3M6V7G8_9STRA|nr:hypothetical protein DD238_008570 [Peronospora effusa]